MLTEYNLITHIINNKNKYMNDERYKKLRHPAIYYSHMSIDDKFNYMLNLEITPTLNLYTTTRFLQSSYNDMIDKRNKKEKSVSFVKMGDCNLYSFSSGNHDGLYKMIDKQTAKNINMRFVMDDRHVRLSIIDAFDVEAPTLYNITPINGVNMLCGFDLKKMVIMDKHDITKRHSYRVMDGLLLPFMEYIKVDLLKHINDNLICYYTCKYYDLPPNTKLPTRKKHTLNTRRDTHAITQYDLTDEYIKMIKEYNISQYDRADEYVSTFLDSIDTAPPKKKKKNKKHKKDIQEIEPPLIIEPPIIEPFNNLQSFNTETTTEDTETLTEEIEPPIIQEVEDDDLDVVNDFIETIPKPDIINFTTKYNMVREVNILKMNSYTNTKFKGLLDKMKITNIHITKSINKSYTTERYINAILSNTTYTSPSYHIYLNDYNEVISITAITDILTDY